MIDPKQTNSLFDDFLLSTFFLSKSALLTLIEVWTTGNLPLEQMTPHTPSNRPPFFAPVIERKSYELQKFLAD